MSSQKHLGLILDEKLNFKQHIESAIVKINKGVAVTKKLRYSLPHKSLITIYKAFLRTLIDYGDIIYDQPQNESFCEKLESVQYKAALAITGAIKGPSREKLFQELGLEPLKSRRWYRRLCCMYKIMKKAPHYLTNLIPKSNQSFTAMTNSIPKFCCRTDCYKTIFFPSEKTEYNSICNVFSETF